MVAGATAIVLSHFHFLRMREGGGHICNRGRHKVIHKHSGGAHYSEGNRLLVTLLKSNMHSFISLLIMEQGPCDWCIIDSLSQYFKGSLRLGPLEGGHRINLGGCEMVNGVGKNLLHNFASYCSNLCCWPLIDTWKGPKYTLLFKGSQSPPPPQKKVGNHWFNC